MMKILLQSMSLLVLLGLSAVAQADMLPESAFTKYLKNENRAIVASQKYIDYGEYDHANQFLALAVKRFPASSMLAALYGKSLYYTDKEQPAEVQLMRALALNPENTIAQKYIEHIRLVRELTESEESQEWDGIMKDKIGDLIVFVVSIWLGTSFNSIWGYFLREWRWHQAKRCYVKKDYDDVVRILESYMVSMDQGSINKCLQFMLSKNNDVEEVAAILAKFVVREDDLKVLLRSLHLITMPEFNM